MQKTLAYFPFRFQQEQTVWVTMVWFLLKPQTVLCLRRKVLDGEEAGGLAAQLPTVSLGSIPYLHPVDIRTVEGMHTGDQVVTHGSVTMVNLTS